ncbi:MAG: hypothetical protein J0I99_19315, partial [Devosia sp.]|uniref:hypothetical protein n=1 Tax=Devosia sp. TaxID=1871048 RepID=UPI001AD3C7EE
LPLQEQLRSRSQNHEGESQNLDHQTRPETYLEAGHFSVEIPGQFSAEINILRTRSSEKITLPTEALDQIVLDLKASPFQPMTGQILVPESAITDALMEQDFARMVKWEAEHRDEMRAQYEEAQEGWDRIDFTKRD